MKANIFLLIIVLSTLNGIRRGDETIIVLSLMLLPISLMYKQMSEERNNEKN